MKEFWDSYRYTVNPIGHLDPDGRGDYEVAMLKWVFGNNGEYAKDLARGTVVEGLNQAEQVNNVANYATNAGALLDPEPSSKAGFLLANQISDATAVAIDATQLAMGEGTKGDLGVSLGGMLLGRAIGKLCDRIFGALSPTVKNPNAFKNVETGRFSSKTMGKMGQNIDAGTGQVVNVVQDKLTKK